MVALPYIRTRTLASRTAERKAKKAAKAACADVFARELAILSSSEPIYRVLDRVLDSYCGPTREGQAWKRHMRHQILTRAVRDGETRKALIARRRSQAIRTLLRLYFRLVGMMRRHGARIVATGVKVWIGKQHRTLDHRVGMPPKRKYTPHPGAGSHAARLQKSVSTTYRHAALLEKAGLLARVQPPADSPDGMGLSSTRKIRAAVKVATRARKKFRRANGQWAYAMWYAPHGLPAAALQRLRESWGERVRPEQVAAPVESQLPPRLGLDAYTLPAPGGESTGPPFELSAEAYQRLEMDEETRRHLY